MGQKAWIVVLVLTALLWSMTGTALAETRVTLKDYLPYENGKTRIEWDVTGDEASSYKVLLQLINNGTASQTRWNVGKTDKHYIQTSECLPGKAYEITVTDANNNVLDRASFQMDEPETFVDGKLKNTSIKITTKPRKVATGTRDYKDVKALKKSEIIEGVTSKKTYYGIRYQMKMPQLVKERSFFVTLAFESPDGYVYVEQATDVEFSRVSNGYQTLWWEITGMNFFANLYSSTGDIPTGTYTVYLYWDGMWVNTTTFKVS